MKSPQGPGKRLSFTTTRPAARNEDVACCLVLVRVDLARYMFPFSPRLPCRSEAEGHAPGEYSRSAPR